MKDKDRSSKKRDARSGGTRHAKTAVPGSGWARSTGRTAKPAAPAQMEARFQAVFEGSRDAIGVSKAGIHVFVNPAYCTLFGFPPDADLAGTPILNLIAPECRDQVKEHVTRRARGKSAPSTYETRGLSADGSEFDMEVSVSSYQENGEDHTLVILRNITERKMADQEIAERGAALQQIMDTASVAIFLVDRSGRIVHANRRMTEMFGCSMEEIVGSEYVEHVHPSERETGRKKMLALLASEIPSVDLERLYWRKDGTEFWGHLAGRRFHDVHGNELGLIGVITDIDKRKRAEEALQNTDQLFSLFMLKSPIYTLIKEVTPTASRVLYASENFQQIVGTPGSKMVGKAMDELFPSEFAAKMTADDWTVVSRGQVLQVDEDLNGRNYTTIKSPLIQGDRTLLVGYTIDITDRKRAEDALRDSEVRTRSIIESIPVGMHMYRLEPDGRLVFTGTNPAADRILGVDNSVFIGKTIEEAFPPLKDTEVPQRYRDVARTGKAWQTESIEYQDGAIKGAFEVHAFQTAPNMMVAAFEDITVRKRSEAALKQSGEKYRRLYNETPVMLHSIDRKAVLVDVNEHWLNVMGYERDEVIGRKVTDFYTGASKKYAQEVIQPAFFRDGVVKDVPYQFVKKNGELVDVLLSATGERDAAGTVVRSQAVIVDITERKHAVDLLRESEEKFRMLVETSYDWIWAVDENGVYTYASPRVKNILGYTAEEVMGKTPFDFMPTKERERVAGTFEKTMVKKVPLVALENINLHKDGRAVILETSGMPIFDREGLFKGYRGIDRDITERKQMEEELKASSTRYRILYEGTPVMMHSIDLEGKLVSVSDHWLKTLGYTREEVLGRRSTEFLDEQSSTYARTVVLPEFMRTGVCSDIPYTFVKKNGERISTLLSAIAERDEAGKVLRSLAVIIDITERKRVEEQLRESESRFRRLVEHSPIAISIIDRTGRIEYINKKHAEITGYTVEEVPTLEVWWSRIYPDKEMRKRITTAWGDTARKIFNGEDVDPIERTIVCKDGSSREVELRFSLAGDRILAVFVDITERKRVAEALQKSEEKYRNLFDNSEIAMFRTRLDGSEVLDVNQKWLDLVGMTREEALGKPSTIVWEDPNERQRMVRMLLADGRVSEFAFNMLNKKRGVRNCITSLRLYRDQGILEGSIADITVRKKAEDALRESEERFKAITTTASDAILLMDDKGMIIYWNPAAERIFGYSADEAVDRELHVFLAPQRLHSEYHKGFARFVTTGQGPVINRSVEMVAMKKEGAEFPIEVSTSAMKIGGRWHALGIVRDITERKRAEEALRLSEERFRNLAESLPLTVFEIDQQGRFTYVNRAALEKFGYSQQEVDAGLNMAQMIAPGDRDRVREVMASRLTGNVDGYQEYQGLRKDGTTFPITVASGPILRDGRPVGLRGIVSDLSERKQLEEERLKSQKLESIGTLAGGIAHDFNNLLQGIFGYISMAKLTIDQREKSLAMLEQAEKALHQSVNLTSQLLTFSKGGKPVKKVIDLRPVIENAAKFALSGSRSDLRVDIAPGLWHADADGGQVGQVIQNIVLNADQAMPIGGRVEISARNLPASETASHPGLERRGYVVIMIEDQGVGIPEAYLDRIFDPYFTTKEKGSGLGLATSYSIIRNHDGMIEVGSEVGKGSTFLICLPASEAVKEEPVKTAVPVGTRTGRILVMDDEELIRRVAGELLGAFGHTVAFADRGETALDVYRAAREEGKPFDLVILDLTIRGGKGGAETLRELLAIDPDVKAVVSSGYSDDEVVATYRQQGFRAFLKKPYNMQELGRVLSEVMA